MKILMVNKYAKITGGADRHFLDLHDALVHRGHSVRVLSTCDRANARVRGAFVPPTVTHANRGTLRSSEQISVAARALWNRSAGCAMAELIDRFRPDIVHLHKLYPQLSVAPLFVAKRYGLPVVQKTHDYEFLSAHPEDSDGGWIDRAESSARYRTLNTAMFFLKRSIHVPRVEGWIAPSRFVAARYATRGIQSEILPYFVPQVAAGPAYDRRDGVAFISRLVSWKGVRDVIDLARSQPELNVVIAGDGPLQDEVREASGTLPNLEYCGFVQTDRVLEIVRSARVAIVPSRWAEPGGIVALDAMAVGTPVVAYASGGLAEYVSDSGGGVLVPPDSSSLATAVSRLHRNKEWWMAASRRGMEAIRTIHSAEHYTSRLEGIYDHLVSRSSSQRNRNGINPEIV